MKTPFALNYVNTKLICSLNAQLGNHCYGVSHCGYICALPVPACGLCVHGMQIEPRNIAVRAAGGADRLPLL